MLKFLVNHFAVFGREYGYTNPLFWKHGGWRLVLRSHYFKKNMFNVLTSILDLM